MHLSALFSVVVLASLLLASPTRADPEVVIGSKPMLGGGVFSTGGGLTVVVEAHEAEGGLHLCGVWARSEFLSAYVASKVSFVLTQGVVQAGGRTLLRDFRVFRQVDAAKSYEGAAAKCVPISGSVQDMVIRIPVLPLVRDRGNGGFVRVDFTESPKENPAFTNGSLQRTINSAINSKPQS